MRLIQPLHEQRRTAVGGEELRGFEQARVNIARRLVDDRVEIAHRNRASIGAVEKAAHLVGAAIEDHAAQTLG